MYPFIIIYDTMLSQKKLRDEWNRIKSNERVTLATNIQLSQQLSQICEIDITYEAMCQYNKMSLRYSLSEKMINKYPI